MADFIAVFMVVSTAVFTKNFHETVIYGQSAS